MTVYKYVKKEKVEEEAAEWLLIILVCYLLSLYHAYCIKIRGAFWRATWFGPGG